MPFELSDDRAPVPTESIGERRELRGVAKRAMQQDHVGAQRPPRLRSAGADLLCADATFAYREGSTAT